MKGPPLGPAWQDITWPDQVAPRGQIASSTRKIKPQNSNPHRVLSNLNNVQIVFRTLGLDGCILIV